MLCDYNNMPMLNLPPPTQLGEEIRFGAFEPVNEDVWNRLRLEATNKRARRYFFPLAVIAFPASAPPADRVFAVVGHGCCPFININFRSFSVLFRSSSRSFHQHSNSRKHVRSAVSRSGIKNQWTFGNR